MPQDATTYTPDGDSPEGRAVADWTSAMDHHIEALAKAVAAINGEPKLPKLSIVAG